MLRMRERLLILIGCWWLGLTGLAAAQTEAAFSLPHPQRVAWIVTESLDAQPLAAPVSLSVWHDDLERIGLRFLSEPRTQALLARCASEIPNDTPSLCSGFEPSEVDWVISGTLAAVSEHTPDGLVGARLTLTLWVFRVDSGARLFEQRLVSYAAHSDAQSAYRAALARLSTGLAQMLAVRVRGSLDSGLDVRVNVDGFVSREEQDDFLLGLRRLDGLRDLNILDEHHDSLALSWHVVGDSLNGFFERAMQRQGSGFRVRQLGRGTVEAGYERGRAFRLPTAVTAFSAPGTGSEAWLAALDDALGGTGVMAQALPPSRLPAQGAKAAKQLAEQYGPAWVIVPHLEMRGTEPWIELTLTSSFAGEAAKLSERITGDPAHLAPALLERLERAGLEWLHAKGSALRGLRLEQWKASGL